MSAGNKASPRILPSLGVYLEALRWRFKSPVADASPDVGGASFEGEPEVSSYLYNAYSLGILGNYSAATLNINVQLRFVPPSVKAGAHNVLEIFPQSTFDLHQSLGDLTFRYIGALPIDMRMASFNSIINGILGEGAAFLFVDFFYVPNSPAYLKYHFWHEILVSATKKQSRAFRIHLYNRVGIYTQEYISEKLLFTAFFSQAGLADVPSYCRPRHIAEVKALRKVKVFDVSDIGLQLLDFLNGECVAVFRSPNQALKDWVLSQYNSTPEASYGLAVYDELSSYLKNVAQCGIKTVDFRVTRVLWEHKKLMRIRLKRLSASTGQDRPGWIQDYDEIVSWSRQIHYAVFHSFRINADFDLPFVLQRLEEIRDRERKLLRDVAALALSPGLRGQLVE